MYEGLVYLDRNLFGRHSGALTFLVLVLYTYSNSTSPRVSGLSQNAAIDLRNKSLEKSLVCNISETSRLVTMSYGTNKKNSKPGIEKQNNSGLLCENILSLDMVLPKTECMLGKEATDFLLWLDIDPNSNSLDCLNRFKKNSESPVREQEALLELLYNNFTLNLITFKTKKQAAKLRQIQDKKTTSRRWLNNSSSLDKGNMPKSLQWNGSAGALDPSLKRFKRQTQAEEAEQAELPRWPGAPQDILRKPLSKSAVQRKVYNMMTQALYSTQQRLWPLESIVRKYEHFTAYRMAFIFLKLDQLVLEMHSIYTFLSRKSGDEAMTMTRRLQLYGHLVRRNVDVTYLTEYIMQRVPRDQVIRIRQALIRQQQEKIMQNIKNRRP